MTKLKPCPFCGGNARIRHQFMSDGFDEYVVVCIECGATVPGTYDIHGDQAEWYWNDRAERTCDWKIQKSGTLYDVYQCSECGYEYAESRVDSGIKNELIDANYCPHCGAKVTKEKESE